MRVQGVEGDNAELRAELHAVADDMEVLVRENQTTAHHLSRAQEAVAQLEGDLAKVSRCFMDPQGLAHWACETALFLLLFQSAHPAATASSASGKLRSGQLALPGSTRVHARTSAWHKVRLRGCQQS